MNLPFRSIPCNEQAHLDLKALEKVLKTGKVGTVVATIGSTGAGTIDPLPEILKLKEKYAFRLHADAAYGGYFTLIENLSLGTRQAFDLLS